MERNVALSVRGLYAVACAVPSSPGMHWALLESPARQLVCPEGWEGAPNSKLCLKASADASS